MSATTTITTTAGSPSPTTSASTTPTDTEGSSGSSPTLSTSISTRTHHVQGVQDNHQQQQQQQHQQQPPRSSSPSCTCPTSLHTLNESITRSYSQCPVCLSKFDTGQKLPIALQCSHTICLNCAALLIPNIQQNGGGVGGGSSKIIINQKLGTVNYPLLSFLDYKLEPGGGGPGSVSGSAPTTTPSPEVMLPLCNIARLIRSHTVSRSIHRKTIVLINSLTPGGGEGSSSKLYKPIKSLGERTLVELTSSCAHGSAYHAQQQLWAAIRARACQFMGPAMQDEALKLVLLALEDGSALSRKVLVMFVVQRLAPQFPQASKTSVGHIVQLLYRASAFDVLKRQGNSSLMTLRPEFRNYEALRREHDTQIMKIGLEAGIRFTPEQWSSLLYGDTSQKPLMQSIIDKLQSPQTFQELLKEYLVSVQRLSNPDSQFLVSLHPHFKVLSLIEIGTGGGAGGSNNNNDQTNSSSPEPLSSSPTSSSSPLSSLTPPPPLPTLLESLYSVLFGLITFTANRKHQRSTVRPAQQQQQQSNNNNSNTSSSNNGGGGGGGSSNGVMMMMYGVGSGAGPNNNKHQQQHSPPSSSPPYGMKMGGDIGSGGCMINGESHHQQHHHQQHVNPNHHHRGHNNVGSPSNNSANATPAANNNNLVNMMQANLCI